jgi:hypothetical protein
VFIGLGEKYFELALNRSKKQTSEIKNICLMNLYNLPLLCVNETPEKLVKLIFQRLKFEVDQDYWKTDKENLNII